MQRRDGAANHRPEQRELELVDMEMDDVKFLGSFVHPAHHQHEIGNRIAHRAIEPQRHGNTGDEVGRSDRVAAGEQRHVMAEADEFFRKIRNDPLSAAIKPRGNTLE